MVELEQAMPHKRIILTLFALCIVSILSTLSLNTKMKKICRSVVVCGPSGVGKGTLISRLLGEYPNRIGLSVSHTSRSPRDGEIDGFHYHFVTREQLENDIRSGPVPYLEYASVHSNLYGTRQDAVDSIHQQNKLCLLDLDTNGVKSVKTKQFDAKYLFIAPPSFSSLENQLRGRGTESEDKILIRLRNAKEQIEYGTREGNFDKVVVNHDLETCYNEIRSILEGWFPFICS